MKRYLSLFIMMLLAVLLIFQGGFSQESSAQRQGKKNGRKVEEKQKGENKESRSKDQKPDKEKEKKASTDPEKAETVTKSKDAGIHTVKAEDVNIEVKLTGYFESQQEQKVEIRPEVWTTWEVAEAVEHGTRVNKGELLVRFDDSDFREEQRKSELGLKKSHISFEQAKVEFQALNATFPLDKEAMEKRHQEAIDDLKYYLEVELPQSKESTKRSLQNAEFRLEYAQEELNQLEKMYKEDELTEETEEIILKRARRDAESAEYWLKDTRLRTDRMLKTSLPRQEHAQKVQAQRSEIEYKKSSVTLPATAKLKELDMQLGEIEFKDAKEKHENLLKDGKFLTVNAPTDGIVYYGSFKRGKWSGKSTVDTQLTSGGKVLPKKTFITIVNPEKLQVRVDVPEKDLEHLSAGAAGIVTAKAYPHRKIDAKLTSLSSVPIDDGKFDAVLELSLPKNAPRLMPGMSCSVTLTAFKKEDAITIPPKALFDEDGETVVYISTGKEKHEERTVKVGRQTAQWVEILQGLKKGDKILTSKPKQED